MGLGGSTDSFRELAFRRQVSRYWLGMSASLSDAGWVELASVSSAQDFAKSFALLTYASSDSLSSGGRSVGFVRIEPKPPVTSLQPSVLQFFWDLFQLGDADSTPYNDVLVSYLKIESEGKQKYQQYSFDSLGDAEALISGIQSEAALIFTGRFQSRMGSYRMPLNTQESQQRTFNAICVDLDPVPDGNNEERLMDSVVLDRLFESVDPALVPSYICLTGHGLHLWYIFSEPLQTFRLHNPRRQKYKALSRALYDYFGKLFEGYPCVLDTHCSSLNHGFRAPGSLTKMGDIVKCYCPGGKQYRHSTCQPIVLSKALGRILGADYPAALRLSMDDVIWKSYQQVADEIDARQREYEHRPASEDQLAFIQNLRDDGYIKDDEFASVPLLNAPGASILIQKAIKRRDDARSRHNKMPIRSRWKTKPHPLIAGETGGVYQRIYDSLPKVPVGRRYLTLYMLAGVAYMMVSPIKTKKDVEKDFFDILSSPWARADTPLSVRDIKNALSGYKKENWQTRGSVCRTLGFDPFDEPAKRNGRTIDDHLREVARPALADKRHRAAVEKIALMLEKSPNVSKAEICRECHMSRSTVLKYWQEACDVAGVNRD